jgi:uncharacterized membrane protein
MMPDPLHPAVVHLPIALAILVPLCAALAILSIHKGFLPARSWAAVVLLQAMLVGSTWLAVETGEDQEERVERVVAERYIKTHEEAAERFLALTGGVVAALAILAAGVAVGHSGGALVYEHGAANAYAKLDVLATPGPSGHREHHEDDD